jgi:putative ATP-dependent endonuclease of OLD family
MITKVLISNFRCYRSHQLDLTDGLNILVGNNDAGKSTLLEALGLALTGRTGGQTFESQLSPFHFNLETTVEYLTKLRAGEAVAPPEIIIDVFLALADSTAKLKGTNNALGENSPGLRIWVHPDPDLADDLQELLKDPTSLATIPVEFYRVDWLAFSGNSAPSRGLALNLATIDAASIRLRSGMDYHVQQIIRSTLTKPERASLSREYRSVREQFAGHDSVKAINTKLTEAHADLSSRSLRLDIDLSQRSTWEASLAPHLDELPLQFVGHGEQSMLKVLLALSKDDSTSIILIEEPENHLSFSNLNILVRKIEDKCAGKQVVIATHSSFVLNKLGLGNLVLMDGAKHMRLNDLSTDTERYFRKLPGHDTLRLLLARKVVLVEGPSDELVFQRGYRDKTGHLPSEHGIDVLSARGLSFKRFLQIAIPLQRRVVVLRDNDGEEPATLLASLSEYTTHPFITVRIGADPAIKTLEPQLLAANSLATLNTVLGRSDPTEAALLKHMEANKTECALAIFDHPGSLKMPGYISDAIDDLA